MNFSYFSDKPESLCNISNEGEVDLELEMYKEFQANREQQPKEEASVENSESSDGKELQAFDENTQAGNSSESADEFESVSRYLDGAFIDDIFDFQESAKINTGFENLDEKTSLHTGMYLVGAMPGAGKTTLCTQLADQFVKQNCGVLYFSLEQTRRELVSKGLSRLTTGFMNNGTISRNSLTAIEIQRRGTSDAQVLQAMNEYKRFAVNEHFIAQGFSSISEVVKTVERYIELKNIRPIVFIDYLQIIKPDQSEKATTKDVIDRHVQVLKKLQSDYQLICIVISSFNRANYTAPADYESFKESGGIEYTADVVWGLQLQAIHELSDIKTVAEKRERINQAKNAIPRKVELACIKNRFGPNYSVYFDYYSQYDLFVPAQPALLGSQRQSTSKRGSVHI